MRCIIYGNPLCFILFQSRIAYLESRIAIHASRINPCAKILKDRFDKIQPEFIPVVINVSVHLILVDDTLQISDNKAWNNLKQCGIFRGNNPFYIEKFPGNFHEFLTRLAKIQTFVLRIHK